MCSGVFDESEKAESIVSQLRKTQLNFDKYEKDIQSVQITQYLKLNYGDLVEIHCINEAKQTQMKLKCSLNKIIGCDLEHSSFGYDSDSRCTYQIVDPKFPTTAHQ